MIRRAGRAPPAASVNGLLAAYRQCRARLPPSRPGNPGSARAGLFRVAP